MTLPSIPPALRHLVFERARQQCEYCLISQWDEHFILENVLIVGFTPIGRVTVMLLKLNTSTRLLHRRVLIAQGRYSSYGLIPSEPRREHYLRERQRQEEERSA